MAGQRAVGAKIFFQGLHLLFSGGSHMVDIFFELFAGETNLKNKRSVSLNKWANQKIKALLF